MTRTRDRWLLVRIGKDKVKRQKHNDALSIVEQRTGGTIWDQAIQSGTQGMQLGENRYTYLREIGETLDVSWLDVSWLYFVGMVDEKKLFPMV